MRCVLRLAPILLCALACRSGADTLESAAEKSRPNELEGSQYLDQHATDAIRWLPWSAEISQRARRDSKLIFVSVGYATCHWCAVMHEESFRDPEVAAFLNEHFVSVKVDRDQRPDLDAVFMEMLRALGRPTGWPVNLVLGADLAPIAGATYVPPRSTHGQPGLLDILRTAREHPEGGVAMARLRESAAPPETEAPLEDAMRRLVVARDSRSGGFGHRAKFPHTFALLAELRSGDADAIQHVQTTLDEMMRGGMRDLVEGTFHRYAIDARWHTPHYEKALQSNAHLAALFVEAGVRLRRTDYQSVGRRVLDALLTHWRTEQGFIAGFSADDAEGEGAFYRWTRSQVVGALGPERGATFAELHDLSEEPDVLHRISPAAARVRLGLQQREADELAEGGYRALAVVRARRPAPERHEDVVVAYDAALIETLANTGRWLDEPRYVEAASDAMHTLLECCSRTRGTHGGRSLGPARLEDRASLMMALLRLHEADGDVRWLTEAAQRAGALRASFDEELGTFVDSGDDLPLRRPDVRDEGGPAPTSLATLAGLMFAERSGDAELRGRVDQAISELAPYVAANPIEAGTALIALQYRHSIRREIVLVGQDEDLLEPLLRLGPHAAILRIDDATLPGYPALQGKTQLGGRPTVYVCEWGRCERPVHTSSDLRRRLPANLRWIDPDQSP